MAFDPKRNFAITTVATVPSPAASGTELVVAAGEGALFPAPASSGAFNVVVYPNGEQPNSSNAEIVRVTARTTDTFTITREQEGTSARTIEEGDVVMLGVTRKDFDDMHDLLENNKLLAGGWQEITDTLTFDSVDNPTGVVNWTDANQYISAGMRLRFVNGGNTIHGIATVVTSTKLTYLHEMNTNGAGTAVNLMEDSAITEVYISSHKAPFGFPVNPFSWQIHSSDTSQRQIVSPSAGTWYNVSQLNITVPIGLWIVTGSIEGLATRSSNGTVSHEIAFSTTTSASNSRLHVGAENGSLMTMMNSCSFDYPINETSKTLYRLNHRTGHSELSTIRISVWSRQRNWMSVTCAYL